MTEANDNTPAFLKALQHPKLTERITNIDNPEHPLTYEYLLAELADTYSDIRSDMTIVEIKLAEDTLVAERKRAELIATGDLPGKTVGEREAALLLDADYQTCLNNVHQGESALKAARSLLDIASQDLKVATKIVELKFGAS